MASDQRRGKEIPGINRDKQRDRDPKRYKYDRELDRNRSNNGESSERSHGANGGSSSNNRDSVRHTGDERYRDRRIDDRNRDRNRGGYRGGPSRRDLFKPNRGGSLYIPGSSSSSTTKNPSKGDDRTRNEREEGEKYRGYDRSRDTYFHKAPPSTKSSITKTTTNTNDKDDNNKKISFPRGPKTFQKFSNNQTPINRQDQFTPNRPLPKGPSGTGGLPKGPAPVTPTMKKISFLKSTRPNKVYERVAQVGEGTYGKVYKAQNRITGAYVALKRLRMETEKEGFPITAMRETRLLQSFNHPNIVPLLEIMVEDKQIYMIFEYADHDLTGLLSNPEVSLSDGNRKFLFKQLCEGLNYLHVKRVIHRDIKGSNLLIDKNGVLKIADFGLARNLKAKSSFSSSGYTNRVITLWYRPPELLLGTTEYGLEVDIWGIGCLLVELFTKRAVFQAQDEIGQLNVIFQILGTPTFENWQTLNELPWYEMVKPTELYHSQFEKLYGGILTENCFQLALRMLEYDPKNRITCKEALAHEYFSENPQPEPLGRDVLVGEWHEFEAKKKRRKEREEKKLEERKKRQRTEVGSSTFPKSNTEDLGATSASEKLSFSNNDQKEMSASPIVPHTGPIASVSSLAETKVNSVLNTSNRDVDVSVKDSNGSMKIAEEAENKEAENGSICVIESFKNQEREIAGENIEKNSCEEKTQSITVQNEESTLDKPDVKDGSIVTAVEEKQQDLPSETQLSTIENKHDPIDDSEK